MLSHDIGGDKYMIYLETIKGVVILHGQNMIVNWKYVAMSRQQVCQVKRFGCE